MVASCRSSTAVWHGQCVTQLTQRVQQQLPHMSMQRDRQQAQGGHARITAAVVGSKLFAARFASGARKLHRGRGHQVWRCGIKCSPPAWATREHLPAGKQNLLYDDGPRSSWLQVLGRRDLPCILFLCWGVGLAACNVAGALGLPPVLSDYEIVLAMGVVLGGSSGLAGFAQALWDPDLPDDRPGIAGEAMLTGFYAVWCLATVWLCARLGAGFGGLPAFPSSLEVADPYLCLLCIAVFIAGATGPVMTVATFRELPEGQLTALESYRLRGLAMCGLPGVLYMVIAVAISVGGGSWWGRVAEAWPMQRPCEQTTLLCGALAVEACMLLHRLGRGGVVRFRGEAVPAGIILCVLLTLVPTAAQLYWHRSDISFWEFYFV